MRLNHERMLIKPRVSDQVKWRSGSYTALSTAGTTTPPNLEYLQCAGVVSEGEIVDRVGQGAREI